MGFDPIANHSSRIKKKGAYIRRGRDSTVKGKITPRFMYLVETRKPEPDTPAALYWEMHHHPHEHSQPPEKKTYPPRGTE